MTRVSSPRDWDTIHSHGLEIKVMALATKRAGPVLGLIGSFFVQWHYRHFLLLTSLHEKHFFASRPRKSPTLFDSHNQTQRNTELIVQFLHSAIPSVPLMNVTPIVLFIISGANITMLFTEVFNEKRKLIHHFVTTTWTQVHKISFT